MMTSLPVWAIVVAHFAENWGFYTWLTELPSFMKHVLNVDIVQSGFFSALPYMIMCIIVIFGGVLADMLRNYSNIHTVTVRKIFTCGAFAVQAIFMVAAGYVMTKAAAITCLTLAVGIGGFAWAGFSVNHLDIAPQFASILMGVSNTFATLPGIISPGLTGAVVTDQESPGEWQIIFYLAAGIYAVGALVYGLLASGDRQEWAQVPMGYQPYLDDPEKDQ